MIGPVDKNSFEEALTFFANATPNSIEEGYRKELFEAIKEEKKPTPEIARHIETLHREVPEGVSPTLVQRAASVVNSALKTKKASNLSAFLQDAQEAIHHVKMQVPEPPSTIRKVTSVLSGFFRVTPVDLANQVLGKDRVLNPKMSAMLDRNMREIPGLEPLFRSLCLVILEEREKNIVKLQQGASFLTLSEKMLEVGSQMENHFIKEMPIAKRVKEFSHLKMDLMERAQPLNLQLHSDSVFLGLFEKKINFNAIDNNYAETFPNPENDSTMIRSLQTNIVKPYLEQLEKIGEVGMKGKPAKMPSALFAPRNTDNLKQTVSWTGIEYFPSGGLKKATRVIGFATESGKEVVKDIVLDLGSLGIEDEEASKAALTFARRMFDKGGHWNALADEVHREKTEGRNLNIKAAYGFMIDKVDQAAWREVLDALEPIEESKRDAVFSHMIDFNWKVNRAFSTALLET